MLNIECQWLSAMDAQDRRGAPLFRREFLLDAPPVSGTLNISGLGYYEAWVNGQRVGDHVLDPAQTDYEQRVFYVTHDITGLVQPGINCIGVMLGNGWYNQNRAWGENGLSYGQPQFLLALHVSLSDKSSLTVKTDPCWKCAPGPITDNNIYAGEQYDARLEQPGWNRAGFDDSSWESVVVAPGTGGTLEQQKIPPIRRIEDLAPIAIKRIGSGHYVVDMGQNFSGWARIKVEAAPGTKIQLRFAETIAEDGSIDTASTGVFATGVEQIDSYICKGTGLEQWEPRFTYHGFRYIDVTGWPGELTADSITGVVVHTDLPSAGLFESSDDRLNQLHRMALWTHRSNIHSIPEDCPARERCGWLGDANLVAELSMWNYEAKSFWEKYLADIETSRLLNDGIPTNIAPGKRGSRRNANYDWAAAYIMLPWYIYLHYGDEGILRQYWDGMEFLMKYYSDNADGWILQGGYGDYFDPGTDAIVMHTPQALSTSFWFYRCADVMACGAKALGKTESENKYSQWRKCIATAITDKFFDEKSGSFGSQSANALALAFDVLPDEDERIAEAMVKDILERDTHLNVGVMGVRYIFEELSKRGHGDLAMALMHQNSYPSFGHLIERGATTLWECWGEAKHDGTHGPRSMNHPFMGGYDNWFYNTLAGIRPDPEEPGFSHFFLEPHLIYGLTWVKVQHNCSYGQIVSAWRIDKERFEWKVTVPQKTRATARLPFTGRKMELGAGSHEIVDAQE